MSFHMLMAKILRGLNWRICLVYIDDILCFSENFQTHLQHLRLIFQRLREANLTLQTAKCKFAAKRVIYLGHILSKSGIEVDPDKTRAISTLPPPQNPKKLRSFMGMANYYRKYIFGYSKICTPLNALLYKNAKYIWTESCQQAFDTIKSHLLNAPILHIQISANHST